MDKFENITIQRGATKLLKLDLSGFNLNGGKIKFLIKDMEENQIVFEREFDEQGIFTIQLNDEFTATLQPTDGINAWSRNAERYKYGIVYHYGEERQAQCLPSDVHVFEIVGGFGDDE